MTYPEAISWLYSTQQFGIKLGLEQPTRLLRETLAFPKSGVKVVHVAGTNGKGSTCALLDSLARTCGTRCGLFTSPHLLDYRERIQVSGIQITEETTARYLTELREAVVEWEHHPTFFELTLAVAMRFFREQSCELIILETGMGGRLDATTAVPADVAVITPIAMDHSQWLGETIAEVAAEKAGIIVPKKPVFSSNQLPAARSVIEQTANEQQCAIEFITEPLEGYHVNLPGAHQKQNAALALAAAHAVSLPLNSDTVRQALAKVSWPGRFELLTENNIILDAAHNPHAAEALVNTWQEVYLGTKTDIIFGAVEGKNTEKVLAILAPIAKHFHLVPVDSPRALSTTQLADALQNVNHPSTHQCHDDLADALSIISPTPAPPTLVTGSLFLLGQCKGIVSGTATQSSSQ